MDPRPVVVAAGAGSSSGRRGGGRSGCGRDLPHHHTNPDVAPVYGRRPLRPDTISINMHMAQNMTVTGVKIPLLHLQVLLMLKLRRPIRMVGGQLLMMMMTPTVVSNLPRPSSDNSRNPPSRHSTQSNSGKRRRGGGHGVQVAAVQAPFAGAVVAPVAAVFCLRICLLGGWVCLEGGGCAVVVGCVGDAGCGGGGVGCVSGGNERGDGCGGWCCDGVRGRLLDLGGRLRVVDGAGDAGWRVAPVGSHLIGWAGC